MALISTRKTAASHRAPQEPSVQQIWSRRRWAGVLIVAVTLLAGLGANEISGRTALMLGGMLLAFALSADRLDQPEE
jgi:hypothetical protein